MRKVILLFALVCLLGCTNDCSKRLEGKFQTMNENTNFLLSSMCEPFDSAYVVTPYSQELPIEKNVMCRGDLKRKIISEYGSPENSTFLIFVRNGEVVSYAEISREYADFSTLGEKAKIHRGQRLYLDENRRIRKI